MRRRRRDGDNTSLFSIILYLKRKEKKGFFFFFAFSIILLKISLSYKFCKHISQIASRVLETQVSRGDKSNVNKKST